MDEVRSAKVGHVIASLKSSGRHHALAIESGAREDAARCAVFSRCRRLRAPLGVAIYTTEPSGAAIRSWFPRGNPAECLYGQILSSVAIAICMSSA